MRHRFHTSALTLTSAVAAAALALTLPTTAHAQEPHPLIGTWSGTWRSGATSELTVATVTDGAATGIACTLFKHGGLRFFDLHPDRVPASVTSRGRLRHQARALRHEYRPHRRDPDRMKLHERSKGKTYKLDVQRIDPETATCRSRVRTVDEGMARPAAPTGESPLVGLWRGRWGETDAVTEIAVWRVDGDTVHATYCHQNGPSYWIADLMPGDALDSRVGPGGDLRFHEAANPDISWILTPHWGALSMQYLRNGERSTVSLAKTDEPGCLSRVAPHPDSADRG